MTVPTGDGRSEDQRVVNEVMNGIRKQEGLESRYKTRGKITRTEKSDRVGTDDQFYGGDRSPDFGL